MSNLNSFYTNYSNIVGERMDAVVERFNYDVPRELVDVLVAVTQFGVDYNSGPCVESYEKDLQAITKHVHEVVCDQVAGYCDAETQPEVFTLHLTKTEAAEIGWWLFMWENKNDYDLCTRESNIHILTNIFPYVDIEKSVKDKLQDWFS